MALIERGGCSSVFVGGATYEVKAEATIKVGGIIRKEVESSNGVAGYTTSYKAPSVELQFMDGPAVSVAAIKAIDGESLQITMNNGKNWLLVNATQVDDPDVKVAEGMIDAVKFTGSLCKEVLAS